MDIIIRNQFIDDVVNIRSMVQWVVLLNYAGKNEEKLSTTDLKFLANISEGHREFWNREQIKETRVVSHAGNVTSIESQKPGFSIERDNVFPNIHKMIESRAK